MLELPRQTCRKLKSGLAPTGVLRQFLRTTTQQFSLPTIRLQVRKDKPGRGIIPRGLEVVRMHRPPLLLLFMALLGWSAYAQSPGPVARPTRPMDPPSIPIP